MSIGRWLSLFVIEPLGPVTVTIPDDVKISVKARIVTVTGPRGSITKRLNHLPIDIKVIDMSKV
jgi:large subunit ribosomal protein L9e